MRRRSNGKAERSSRGALIEQSGPGPLVFELTSRRILSDARFAVSTRRPVPQKRGNEELARGGEFVITERNDELLSAFDSSRALTDSERRVTGRVGGEDVSSRAFMGAKQFRSFHINSTVLSTLILNSFQVETNNPRLFRNTAQSIGIGG